MHADLSVAVDSEDGVQVDLPEGDSETPGSNAAAGRTNAGLGTHVRQAPTAAGVLVTRRSLSS